MHNYVTLMRGSSFSKIASLEIETSLILGATLLFLALKVLNPEEIIELCRLMKDLCLDLRYIKA